MGNEKPYIGEEHIIQWQKQVVKKIIIDIKSKIPLTNIQSVWNTSDNKSYFNIAVQKVQLHLILNSIKLIYFKVLLKNNLKKKKFTEIVLKLNINVNNTYNISSTTFKKCNNCEKIKPVF